MKALILLLFFTLSFISCSKNETVFAKKITTDVGNLSIENESGFIGATIADSTIDHTLVVRASGGLDISHISLSMSGDSEFSFKDGAYPGTGGTCTTSLISGTSCTVVITFNPLSTRSFRTDLHFTYQDTLSSKSLDYTLTADSHPILYFEYGTSYDFGNKFIGTSTDLRVRISNRGKVIAQSLTMNNLSAPYSFKGGSYPGVGGTCGNTLNLGDTCEIVINYSPVTNQQHLQTINLDYLNMGRAESNSLTLKAWGFKPAALTIIPENTNSFGDVSTGFLHQKVYTITHSDGDVTASLLSIDSLSAPFSRVGGTCGSSLSIADHSCTIIVGMSSLIAGNWSDDLNFHYHNGVELKTVTNTITATTKEKPTLSLSTSTVDFGVTKVGQNKSVTITLSYDSGDIPATDIQLSSSTAPFSRTGGTCGVSLSSGSCTIILHFTPTEYGNFSDNIVLSYNNTQAVVTLPVSMSGSSEALIYNSYNGSFSTTVTNQVTRKRIKIYVRPGTPLTSITTSISGPFSFSGGSYPGTGGNCSSTLVSNTCYFYLDFAPKTSGVHTGDFVINYNNGVENTSFTIALSGTATEAAILTLEGKSYPDTPVYSSSQAGTLITLTNTSSMNATTVTPTLPNGFAYRGGSKPGLSGTCFSTTLSAGSSCKLDIVFTPPNPIVYNSTLQVTFNDGVTSQTVTSTLTGTGTSNSDLSISHFDLVTFASTYEGYQSATIPVTIHHGGGATTATDIALSTSDSQFTIVTDNCSTLSATQSCVVSLRFDPTSSGTKTGQLILNYKSEGSDKSTSRNLKGTGRETGKITSTPSTFNFGARPITGSYDKTITITKISSRYVRNPTGSFVGSGFSFKGGSFPGTGGTCSSSAYINPTCTVVVSFTPSAYIDYNSTLRIRYHDGKSYVTTDTLLTGSGMKTGTLSFSLDTYDFGKVIQSLTNQKTITVTNTGELDVSLFSSSSLSAPYRYLDGIYPGTGATCSDHLASGSSCTINVVFYPDSIGIQTRSLTLTYNNSYEDTTSSTTLSGEGIAQAIISISESNPYDFGTISVGSFIDKEFILTNVSDVAATSLTATFNSNFDFTGGSFPGTGATCGTTLNPASSCSVMLRFSPTASGSYSGYFRLQYHDGIETQIEVKELIGN